MISEQFWLRAFRPADLHSTHREHARAVRLQLRK